MSEYKHGEKIELKHPFFNNYIEDTGKECNGEVFWDEVLEGFVCSKCNLYTGVK